MTLRDTVTCLLRATWLLRGMYVATTWRYVVLRSRYVGITWHYVALCDRYVGITWHYVADAAFTGADVMSTWLSRGFTAATWPLRGTRFTGCLRRRKIFVFKLALRGPYG